MMDTPAAQHKTTFISSLISQHLPTLEKLDKTNFIKVYLQEQKAHARGYAAEGRAIISAWDGRFPSPDQDYPATPVQPQHYGFGTPILKPRVARLQEPDAAPDTKEIVKQRDLQSGFPEQRVLVPLHMEQKIKTKYPSQPTGDKPTRQQIMADPKAKGSKKRVASSGSDNDDHATRLIERRERKRAKRAILRPDRGESEAEPPAKQNKRKGEKAKVSAGLSLMYGFSASNIGQNRLTVKPPPNVGVFNKGKASVKTQVTKKGQRGSHFSELGFLNKTVKETRKPKRAKLSSLSSGSASGSRLSRSSHPPSPPPAILTHKDVSKVKKSTEKHEIEVNQASGGIEQHDLDVVPQKCPVSPSADRKSIVESEVWDIENPDYTSKFASSSVDTNSRQGTAMVPPHVLRLADGSAGKAASDSPSHHHPRGKTIVTPNRNSDVEVRSSPSLRPSQSASQCGQQNLVGLNIRPTASKYFMQLATPTMPESIVGPVGESVNACTPPTPQAAALIFEAPQSGSTRDDVNSPPCAVFLDGPVDELALQTPSVSLPLLGIGRRQFMRITSPDSLEQALQNYVADGYDDDLEIYVPTQELGQDMSSGDAPLWVDDGSAVENAYYDYDSCYQQPPPGDRCDYFRGFSTQNEGTTTHLDDCDIPYWYHEEGDQLDYHVHILHQGPADEYPLGWETQDGLVDSGCSQADEGDGDDFTLGFQEFEGDQDQHNNDGDISFNDCVDQRWVISGAFSEVRDHQLDTRPSTGSSCVLQDISTSGSNENGISSVIVAQRFSQGRALLLGLLGDNPAALDFNPISRAEADVAKNMRGHWLPQRL